MFGSQCLIQVFALHRSQPSFSESQGGVSKEMQHTTNTCRQVEACYTTKMILSISVRHTQKMSKCMNEWSYNCALYSHAYNHHLYNSEY